MSKIGKRLVPVPQGVTVTVAPAEVTVKGPKGTLKRPVPRGIRIKQDGNVIQVERTDESRESAINYGTARAHLANMIQGASAGFQKILVLEGVGYRAQATKTAVQLSLGFSHPVEYKIPAGITVETPEPTRLIVSGADVELVGQVSAELRRFRPPEPYKGKGMRYDGERIRRKAGKAAGK
jgi:large subunit ribosomal protein L6